MDRRSSLHLLLGARAGAAADKAQHCRVRIPRPAMESYLKEGLMETRVTVRTSIVPNGFFV